MAKAMVDPDESSARRLVGSMALVLQGALLVRHAPAYVADAFCASRLAADGDAGYGLALGTLPPRVELGKIVTRAAP